MLEKLLGGFGVAYYAAYAGVMGVHAVHSIARAATLWAAQINAAMGQ